MSTTRLEAGELEELLALVSPISGLCLEAGNVTIGADGLDGLLEWASSGEDRPDVLLGIVTACNAAPALIAMARALLAAERERDAMRPVVEAALAMCDSNVTVRFGGHEQTVAVHAFERAVDAYHASKEQAK